MGAPCGDEEACASIDESVSYVYTIDDSQTNRPTFMLELNKQRYRTLLDSGAEASLMCEDVFKRIPSHLTLRVPDPPYKLRSASFDEIKCSGYYRIMLTIGNRTIQHEFCLLYTSPSPRDRQKSRMPSSA